jgi:hypothetical protein
VLSLLRQGRAMASLNISQLRLTFRVVYGVSASQSVASLRRKLSNLDRATVVAAVSAAAADEARGDGGAEAGATAAAAAVMGTGYPPSTPRTYEGTACLEMPKARTSWATAAPLERGCAFPHSPSRAWGNPHTPVTHTVLANIRRITHRPSPAPARF